jgi:hypothetical protein
MTLAKIEERKTFTANFAALLTRLEIKESGFAITFGMRYLKIGSERGEGKRDVHG